MSPGSETNDYGFQESTFVSCFIITIFFKPKYDENKIPFHSSLFYCNKVNGNIVDLHFFFLRLFFNKRKRSLKKEMTKIKKPWANRRRAPADSFHGPTPALPNPALILAREVKEYL